MTELQEQAANAASRHIIERPRLMRLLDQTSARVILLVAPAGYGKTTLARQSVQTRPHAWLQATPASADVAQLAARIATAVSSLTGGDERSVVEFLGRTNRPVDELDALASLQTEQLADWPTDAWLVIDEYEWLDSSPSSEDYIRLLIDESDLNLLVTGRTRPRWATARKRVYGDFGVVDRHSLRMDEDEARRLLSHVDRHTADSLVANAAGWPAVLGLAASGPIGQVTSLVPETLYEYLADELFSKSSRALQETLPKLALSPRVSIDVAKVVSAGSATEVLAEASEAGYFADSVEEPSLHPLLRHFLLNKLDLSAADVVNSARTLTDFFIQRREWDNAFYVIRNAPNTDALLELIDAGHEELLRAGRVITLADWLEAANEARTQMPLIEVLEAELAGREGDAARAERIALQAAKEGDPGLRFRALCLAGRGAHLDNRASAALAHFRQAESLAATSAETQEARWGALLCAVSFGDRTELKKALEAFLSYEPQSADEILRAANARLCTALLIGGGLDEAVDEALAASSLAADSDPVIASSYFNALSRCFILLGRYDDALSLADRSIDLAESARLRFAVPHGLISKAVALLGLQDHAGVEDALDKAERLAADIHDRHNLVDARAVRSRLALSLGDTEAAISATDEPPYGVIDAMRAEYVATRALALACAGQIAEAEYQLDTLTEVSTQPDASGLSVAARAVIAARQRDLASVGDQLHKLMRLGILDPLIVAERGSPELSAALEELDDPSLIALVRVKSNHGAKQGSLLDSLTPRELEVLQLLARGRTNREIAATLVIAEVTAKVHVRHILRKLGVRSRTEAAVLSAALARADRASGQVHDSSDL
jgi:LuxR family transcriptional regulator, maltose regulon positive regulatory protein